MVEKVWVLHIEASLSPCFACICYGTSGKHFDILHLGFLVCKTRFPLGNNIVLSKTCLTQPLDPEETWHHEILYGQGLK